MWYPGQNGGGHSSKAALGTFSRPLRRQQAPFRLLAAPSAITVGLEQPALSTIIGSAGAEGLSAPYLASFVEGLIPAAEQVALDLSCLGRNLPASNHEQVEVLELFVASPVVLYWVPKHSCRRRLLSGANLLLLSLSASGVQHPSWYCLYCVSHSVSG